MKTTILKAVLFVLLAAAASFAFAFFGVYDVGADVPHWAATYKALQFVRDRSIEVRARSIEIPDLNNQQTVLKGAGQYAAMCANCHLAPGKENSEIRPGLYPRPPNLSKQVVDSRTVFWVTKHGLKMSGMPAWGRTHDDATLWSIAAFVTKLPKMSAEQYKEMVAKAPPDEDMKTDMNMKMNSSDKGHPSGGR